ncbi:MAG TPA: amidohydrolase family protein [Vicinamibacterales bacterium]|nr:amidohydrolase family protein [Vicinamibacterales bacterium]
MLSTAAAAAALAVFAGGGAAPVAQQTSPTPALHAKVMHRLVIRNAMVIYGNAKPAYGPMDIVIEDGRIAAILPSDGRPRASTANADATIDATGKYVMPGIVNAHMHWHEERQPGIPQPIQYERNLYLAAGVTTAREVGGDFAKSKEWQAESDAHKIVAPRILVYPFVSKGRTGAPDEIRQWIRDIKQRGADGLKFIGGWDRDQLEAGLDEAHKLGLRTAAHIAVDETNAKDYAELGITSIEHFYGVADAALHGIQDFPADMNLNNETDRFGRAGELYEQADPEKLHQIIDLMVAKHVVWDPTFSIYEASRDLVRAQNQPWFKDYLHPSMEEYFKAATTNHGSYFFGWTSTEENHWRRQYRIWMDAVLEFARKGGMVTTGDDAGYIYSMYGFGIDRELELQEEAGFQPLEVIEHATWNGAQLVGMGDRLGKVREGFIADLLVVNGNPLDNLRLLNPYGTDVMMVNGRVVPNYTPINPGDRVQNVHGGGIEWTIKDGIPYHVPTLMREVKDMVARARSERARATQ